MVIDYFRSQRLQHEGEIALTAPLPRRLQTPHGLSSSTDAATKPARRGKNHLDRAEGLAEPEICHMLGVAMTSATHQTDEGRDLLNAVALLIDPPERGLKRGQVGTIVEPIDETSSLVEFSDDEGRAYAIVPCPREALLILRAAPLAA
jgi:Domain of unknown function (DUF4926)